VGADERSTDRETDGDTTSAVRLDARPRHRPLPEAKVPGARRPATPVRDLRPSPPARAHERVEPYEEVGGMPVEPVPAGYPAEFARELVLEDGRTVHVRPVVPEDVTELRAAIARADPETIRRRFLGGGPPRSAAGLQRLVTVDYVHRFALAAFAPDGTGVGIARYEGESTWPAVDVAVAVDPAWRGVGLGRELMAGVLRRAVSQGATSLTADFFADNVRVRNLLAEAGLPEQRSIDAGVVQDSISLVGDRVAELTAEH
jgi:GNAT superfamily N-acetyltransferase